MQLPKAGTDGHKGSVTALSFNENGYTMASTAEDGARVWDLNKLKCARHLDKSATAYTTRFEQTGGYLAVGSATVCIYSVKQGYSMVRELEDLGMGRPCSVCFGKDARYVAIATGDHMLRFFEPHV